MNIASSLDRHPLACPSTFAGEFASIAGLDKDSIKFIAAVADSAPLGPSELHGFNHWLTVLSNGLEIIKETPEIQSNVMKYVVMIFALFHDSRRETEGPCGEHGKAAAMFLSSIEAGTSECFNNCGPEAVALAAFACECHTVCEVPHRSILLRVGAPSPTGGKLTPTEVAILGACLDADRLDLGRVGIRPDPFYLNSTAAKIHAKASR